jgi:lipoprotein-anchoring transpeptidase ErfK/SrfK
MVGNDFVVRRQSAPDLKPLPEVPAQVEAPAAAPFTGLSMPVTLTPATGTLNGPSLSLAPLHRYAEQANELLHRYSLIVFALLILLVGSSGIQVAARYATAHFESINKPAISLPLMRENTGLNLGISHDQLEAKLQTVTSQPAKLILGEQTIPISPETIRSWLQTGPVSNKSTATIHVNQNQIVSSIRALAAKNLKTPVNQVVVTHDGVTTAIVAGRDGTKLSNPSDLDAQAKAIAVSVLAAKGIQLNAPIQTLPFQSVTPTAFEKLLEVNVVTKQMYAYEKGQLTRSFPISAGAPATPTPIGQYKIYEKLPMQDMRGYNADGTKYFQPHVRWVNYFLPGGYAVHGNYWRPQSWFGAINSSHGCVSLPDDQAKWVYDWAPIGTTVITHT